MEPLRLDHNDETVTQRAARASAKVAQSSSNVAVEGHKQGFSLFVSVVTTEGKRRFPADSAGTRA